MLPENMKAAKIEAGYGANPAGFSCGACRHFSNNRCSIVKGFIRPEDCCNLFSSATYTPSVEENPMKAKEQLEEVMG